MSEKQQELNKLSYVDYVEVVKTKLEVLNDIFSNTSSEFFDDEEYKEFFHANKYWLMPYAAFCYLRDKYQTSDFSNWENFSVYNKKAIEKLSAKNSSAHRDISFHYFVQFHLHMQLKEAADYVIKKELYLKVIFPSAFIVMAAMHGLILNYTIWICRQVHHRMILQ